MGISDVSLLCSGLRENRYTSPWSFFEHLQPNIVILPFWPAMAQYTSPPSQMHIHCVDAANPEMKTNSISRQQCSLFIPASSAQRRCAQPFKQEYIANFKLTQKSGSLWKAPTLILQQLCKLLHTCATATRTSKTHGRLDTSTYPHYNNGVCQYISAVISCSHWNFDTGLCSWVKPFVHCKLKGILYS